MAEKQSTLMPTSTAISSSSTKHVFLHEWWLVNGHGKGCSSGGLIVGGFAHRDDAVVLIWMHGGECRICHWIIGSTQRVSLFYSAPISKRLDTTAILARDGIAISLNGPINLRHTTNNGFSMEVCNKFMVGFPYDWDDYATYHAHQSCAAHADVSDKSKHYSSTEKNITYQSSLEDVPVTSIRDMAKRNDLKNLMDDILAKAWSPKENDEPHAKFVAKRCPEASPVIDVAGYNHDQVRNAEDGMVTPSKKEQNTRHQREEAVCSPNQAGVCKSSAKRCLKASPGKDEAGYDHNPLDANVEVETASSEKRSCCSQPEEAVNCHNRMENSARNMRSVHKVSLIKGMGGQDQDLFVDTDCEIVTPSKKDQSSCYQLEETIFNSQYQTSISPRRIKSCLRSSMGIDATGREHNRLHDTDDEIGTSSSKGQSRCLQLDSVGNPHSRTGVSTRSMTRLKKYND